MSAPSAALADFVTYVGKHLTAYLGIKAKSVA